VAECAKWYCVGDAKSWCPVQGGKGSEDGTEELVASSPELANGELLGTLVEPETKRVGE
jgi:hypothetical protein